MANKKVLFVVAHEGFQPVEYNVPKQIVQNAGYTIVTASNKLSPALATDGSTTNVDLLVKDVKPTDYAGIYLIGGAGAMEALDNEITYKMIKTAETEQVPFGAICVSPRILAKSEVLSGRQATGWNDDGQLNAIFEDYKVVYVPEKVVVENNIVTAIGPWTAKEFGHAIVEVLNNVGKGL